MRQRHGKTSSLLLAGLAALLVGGLLQWITTAGPLFEVEVDRVGNRSAGFLAQNPFRSVPIPNPASPHWWRWIVFKTKPNRQLVFLDPSTGERIDSELVSGPGNAFDRDGYFVSLQRTTAEQVGRIHRFNPATKDLQSVEFDTTEYESDYGDRFEFSTDMKTLMAWTGKTVTVVDVGTGEVKTVVPKPDVTYSISPQGDKITFARVDDDGQATSIEIINASDGSMIDRIQIPTDEQDILMTRERYSDEKMPLTADWRLGRVPFFTGSGESVHLSVARQLPADDGDWKIQSGVICYSLTDKKFHSGSQMPPAMWIKRRGSYPITVSHDGKHTLWYFHLHSPRVNVNGLEHRYCVTQYKEPPSEDPAGFTCLKRNRDPNIDFVPNSTKIAIAFSEMYDSEIDFILTEKLLGAKNYRVVLYDFERDRSLRLCNVNLKPEQAKQKSLVKENAMYCQPEYISLMFTNANRTWIEVWSAKPWWWRNELIIAFSLLLMIGIYRYRRRPSGNPEGLTS